jgi:hypothetical protein
VYFSFRSFQISQLLSCRLKQKQTGPPKAIWNNHGSMLWSYTAKILLKSFVIFLICNIYTIVNICFRFWSIRTNVFWLMVVGKKHVWMSSSQTVNHECLKVGIVLNLFDRKLLLSMHFVFNSIAISSLLQLQNFFIII